MYEHDWNPTRGESWRWRRRSTSSTSTWRTPTGRCTNRWRSRWPERVRAGWPI